MPGTLQTFLADATRKAADELTAALARIPEDKRDWTPGGAARSALDVFAECALLNGSTAEAIRARAMLPDAMARHEAEKAAAVAQGEAHLHELLARNTRAVIDTILETPDDALGAEIATPWRPMTVTDFVGYPYWNMTYHMAQINYLASILGTLE
jgi:uncharacterized damage-inducible protein DinB